MKTDSLLCQCCLKKSQKLPNFNFVPYLQMIQDCFSIQVPIDTCPDGSQPILCEVCIGMLVKCQQFMMMIQASQFALRMTRLTNISTIDVPNPERSVANDDPNALEELLPSSPPSPIDNIEIPKETLGNSSEILENSKIVQKETSFTCKICEKTFQFRENFEFHLKNHSQYAAGEFECKKCSRKFALAKSLAFHARTHRVLDLERDYVCQVCSAKFHSVKFYNRHMRAHRAEEAAERTDDRATLKTTPKKAPRIKLRSLLRAVKAKRKVDSSESANHHPVQRSPRVKRRRNVNKTPRKCEECGKVMATDMYAKHMRIHEGYAPNCCTKCPERFMNVDDKYRHMRDAHGVDINTFLCDKCPKKCHRQGLLNKHIREVHADVSTVTIQCHLCTYQCKRITSLKGHMTTHKSVKDVICHVCGKAFAAKKLLTQHQKLHYNYKALVCDHCGEGFTQRISLRTHLAKAHQMGFVLMLKR